MKSKTPEISIILPCLNEEKSIKKCIEEIKEVIDQNKLDAELIIVDNNSTDNSVKIIKENIEGIDAKLISQEIRGYGATYIKGFDHAKGKYIFIADSDGSYDFKEIPKFINELKLGYDFVIGNRFNDKMGKKAMPALHKYIGNPLLSGILRLFYGAKVKDCHCGMRAIKKEALEKLNLQTTGMEFASEMIVKAGKEKLKIKELPITYSQRIGESKLRSWSDGWRHLRFMLIYSPLWLFFLPGLILTLLGIESLIAFYFNLIPQINPNSYHPMFLSIIGIITGYQLIIFSIFAKTYAINHLQDKPIFNKFYKYLTIERASIMGIGIILTGIIMYTTTFMNWVSGNFNPIIETKKSIIALTIITLGIQSIFSSFMLSILGIKEKR